MSALYDTFKQRCIDGNAVNFTTAAMQAALVDGNDYTFSAAHDFLDDVAPAGAIVAESLSSALGTKTVTNGVFDSADGTWTSVTGDPAEEVVLYVEIGAQTADILIGNWDSGTGFPVTPNSGDINLTIHGSGWFAL